MDRYKVTNNDASIAASRGDIETLKQYRKERIGKLLHTPFVYGWQLMTAAAKSGKFDCVRFLIDNGCKVTSPVLIAFLHQKEYFDYIVNYHCPPPDEHTMTFAVLARKPDMVRKLAKNGFTYTIDTMLTAACEGYYDCLEVLAEFAPFNQITYTDDSYCTNIAASGQLQCLKYFHEILKSPLNEAEALEAAKNNKHQDVVDYILSAATSSECNLTDRYVTANQNTNQDLNPREVPKVPSPDPTPPIPDPEPCVICLDAPRQILLAHNTNEGHLCLCKECSEDLKRQGGICPICRAEIESYIRAF